MAISTKLFAFKQKLSRRRPIVTPLLHTTTTTTCKIFPFVTFVSQALLLSKGSENPRKTQICDQIMHHKVRKAEPWIPRRRNPTFFFSVKVCFFKRILNQLFWVWKDPPQLTSSLFKGQKMIYPPFLLLQMVKYEYTFSVRILQFLIECH